MTESTFSVVCDWCEREVISSVEPPAMTEVTAQGPGVQGPHFNWRICELCQLELIRLIGARVFGEIAEYGSRLDR